MTPWNDVKLDFRNALIDAFDVNSLAAMLEYRCSRRLDVLSAKSEPLDKCVDDVIAKAVPQELLDCLARGALEENGTHVGLQATAPVILQGIDKLGSTYYKPEGEGDPPPEQLDVALQSYLEWIAQYGERLALSLLDPSVM